LSDAEVFGEAIELVRIDEFRHGPDRTEDFALDVNTKVRIYAIGDGAPWTRMFDRIWIENAATGETIWQMHGAETTSEGGHVRNRKADVSKLLPAGAYRLRYQEDRQAHSWNAWEVFPPDHLFWGAAVLRNGR